jgi:hypothetical protein
MAAHSAKWKSSSTTQLIIQFGHFERQFGFFTPYASILTFAFTRECQPEKTAFSFIACKNLKP